MSDREPRSTSSRYVHQSILLRLFALQEETREKLKGLARRDAAHREIDAGTAQHSTAESRYK
jgi:hypothetical protein